MSDERTPGAVIETFSDTRAWFAERLEAALERRSLRSVGEDTRAYLVELLAIVGISARSALSEEPLALQLAAARDAAAGERLRRYRAIGDEALCLSGLFSDHIERRGISGDYVAALGAGAYGTAETLAMRDAVEAPRAGAYHELGERFRDFAAVLDDVRESTVMRTPQDIVRLYDKWRRTRSPLIAERLSAEGVYPALAPKGPTVH